MKDRQKEGMKVQSCEKMRLVPGLPGRKLYIPKSSISLQAMTFVSAHAGHLLNPPANQRLKQQAVDAHSQSSAQHLLPHQNRHTPWWCAGICKRTSNQELLAHMSKEGIRGAHSSV
jgi:precorrin-6B methylase 1